MRATRTGEPLVPTLDYLDATHISLAREIAQGILPLDDILRNYGYAGVGDRAWEALRTNPEFDALLRGAIQEWQAADSTPKRVKLKSAAATEVLIPTAVAMATNRDVAATARIEAMKWLSGLAGFRDGAQTQGPASGFSITFIMGDDSQKIVESRARPVLDAKVETPVEIPADSSVVPESLVEAHTERTGTALEAEPVGEDADYDAEAAADDLFAELFPGVESAR